METCVQTTADELKTLLRETFDVFITSASYEERCFTIARNIPRKAFGVAFVAGNRNHRSYVDQNWTELCSILGDDTVKIEQDTNKPIVGADCFLQAFARLECSSAASVLLDITTFTREALVILLGILKHVISPKGRVVCVYNRAQSYGRESGPLWLSRGIREIRSILGFPGTISSSRRNHLIITFGHEIERVAGLIAEYEPDLLSLGLASREESLSSTIFEDRKMLVLQLKSLYPGYQFHEFETSARNPYKARDSILAQAAQYPDFNTILAPFNTKISVVGSCLAALRQPRIQMCYAQPSIYNRIAYSTPSSEVFMFDLTEALLSNS